MKNTEYYEWLILLGEAKEIGISEEEIKTFLRDWPKNEQKKIRLQLVQAK